MKREGRRCVQGGETRRTQRMHREERMACRSVSANRSQPLFFERWDVGQNKTKSEKGSSLGCRLACGEEVETRAYTPNRNPAAPAPGSLQIEPSPRPAVWKGRPHHRGLETKRRRSAKIRNYYFTPVVTATFLLLKNWKGEMSSLSYLC